MIKICKKCGLGKDLSCFGKNKKLKGGMSHSCKECVNKEHKGWRQKNHDKVKLKAGQSSKKYREKNHDKHLEGLKKWREENKEYINEYNRKYHHKRKSEDGLYIITRAIRGVILSSFRRYRNGTLIKSEKSKNILGCEFHVFMDYIEDLFTEGMSFNNYGEWELDHIMHLCSLNEEELIKLNHHTNFQPLWWKDNRDKSDNIL